MIRGGIPITSAFNHHIALVKRQRRGLSVFELSCHLYTTHGGSFKLSLLLLNIKKESCEYQFL